MITFGAVIAIAFWGSFAVVFVGLLIYSGIEELLWRRDQHRALVKLRARYESMPAEELTDRAVAGFCSYLGDLADQAREIAALPEISDRDRNRRVA